MKKYIYFKMAITIAGSDLKSRVGRVSGNKYFFRPETEFGLDPPLSVITPHFY